MCDERHEKTGARYDWTSTVGSTVSAQRQPDNDVVAGDHKKGQTGGEFDVVPVSFHEPLELGIIYRSLPNGSDR